MECKNQPEQPPQPPKYECLLFEYMVEQLGIECFFLCTHSFVHGRLPYQNLPVTPIICNPSPNAFESALKIANIDPQRTLFFDDSIRNINTAKSIGLHTVLVGSSNRGNGVDYALESIHNIREALPELWEVDEKMKNRSRLSGKIGLESSVVIA